MKTKRKAKIKPTSLILYLTKRCDARCPHCVWILRDPNFFHTRSDLDMPIDKAKEIVDYYYDLGVRSVRLQSEGEILLYEYLEELMAYCKKKGFNRQGFDFPTNGITMGKHIDFILDYLSVISISIDGHDVETFVNHRGGNEAMFNKVINNTRALTQRKRERKAKTVIWINCILHSKDYKKAIPMVKLAEDLGVDKIRFGNFHPIEGGKGLQPIGRKELKYLRHRFNKQEHKVGIKLPRMQKPAYPYHCNMLFRTALIGSDYNFAPCCRIDTNEHWGNFNEDNGMHNSRSLRKLRACFINAKKLNDIPEVCRSCQRLKKGKQ